MGSSTGAAVAGVALALALGAGTGVAFLTGKQAIGMCRKLNFPKASGEGEHLVCSPCGKVAGVNYVNDWPGPEVLLSRLPK
jgi:hypothetical protein